MIRAHAHDLDGLLHSGCDECGLIAERRQRAVIAAANDRALAAHAKRAASSHAAARARTLDEEDP